MLDHLRSLVGEVTTEGHFLSFEGDAIEVLDHFRSEEGNATPLLVEANAR